MANLKAPFSLPHIRSYFSILALFIALILCITSCFSDWQGDKGNIVINLGSSSAGSGNARTAMPWPPQDFEILNKLDYEIELTGNGEKIELTAKGGDIIRVTVSAGKWNVKIDAYYKGVHYATGENSIAVIFGRNNPVEIPMTNLESICPDCDDESISSTCEEEGLEKIICQFESHNIERIIPILDHKWSGWAGTNPPTCTTSGSGTRVCELCTKTETEDNIDPLGHTLTKTDVVAATCTTAGNPDYWTCAVCGKFFADENGATELTAQQIVIAALGHDWNGWEIKTDSISKRTCSQCPDQRDGIIGDIGPAGGIIFHVAPSGFEVQGYSGGIGATEYLNFDSYTAYYLEAAPENMVTTLTWASENELIPGLSNWDEPEEYEIDYAIGRGRLNTAIIIARGDQLYTTPAASTCANLRTGDKDDWFLPSLVELNQLYNNRTAVGNMGTNWFWSSSQDDYDFAWRQNFASGSQGGDNKINGYNIRAVRAF